MKKNALFIFLFSIADIMANAQCKYCNSYEDYVEGRWQQLDTIYCKSHSKNHQVWVGGSDYTLTTGNKATDKILKNEVENGRDPGELVDARDIYRILYKYTPRSTDTPNVLNRAEFDKMASDGRLVLYRGDLPCVSKNGREITIKEINDAFKYGNYYYPFELNSY